MDQPRQSVKGASTYDKISLSQKNNFQRLLSLVEIKQGWKILDIGCGTGNRTKSLAHLVGESGKIIGIDPIEKRIDEAKTLHLMSNTMLVLGKLLVAISEVILIWSLQQLSCIGFHLKSKKSFTAMSNHV